MMDTLHGRLPFSVPVVYELQFAADITYVGRPEARFLLLRYEIGGSGVICDWRLSMN